MKSYESGTALAADMGLLSMLEQTHEEHSQAAKKTEKDPYGGSWPAYPSGKSWDEASGKTGSGKEFYRNIITGSAMKGEAAASSPLLKRKHLQPQVDLCFMYPVTASRSSS